MALLTALVASALALGLGMSLALLSMTEATLAGHDRDARTLRYAARAAGAIAVSELRALPSWSDVGAPGASPEVSAASGRFVDASLSPPSPWGTGTLDLRSLTARIQAESDAAAPSGMTPPQWRLFVYGRMPGPGGPPAPPCYLVAWVAEDRGVVLVQAAALGAAEGRASLEIALVRTATPSGDVVRTLRVRPGS